MSGSNSSDASFAQAASVVPETGGQQPLGLTVHSLPQAGDAMAALQRSRSGRWQMLGLLLVCAAPVIASYFTYYVLRPEGRRNFGELIEPQRALPAQAVATALDGTAHTLGELRGQWLLVSVAAGACDDGCRNNLYLQRQLRETMGREKERMDWVWLVSDGAVPPAEIAPGLQGATVRRVDAATLATWLQPAPGHALAPGFQGRGIQVENAQAGRSDFCRRPVHRYGTDSSGPQPPIRKTRRVPTRLSQARAVGPAYSRGRTVAQ